MDPWLASPTARTQCHATRGVLDNVCRYSMDLLRPLEWVADDWSQGPVAVPPRCGGFRDGKRTPSRAVRDKSRRAGR